MLLWPTAEHKGQIEEPGATLIHFTLVHDEVFFGETLGFETTECFVLSIVAYLRVMLLTSKLPGIRSTAKKKQVGAMFLFSPEKG